MVRERRRAERAGQESSAPARSLLATSSSGSPRPLNQRLAQAMRLIDSRLGDPQLSVTFLAQELKMSRRSVHATYWAAIQTAVCSPWQNG